MRPTAIPFALTVCSAIGACAMPSVPQARKVGLFEPAGPNSFRPPPPPPRDDGRLPDTAAPLSYEIWLHVDPSQPTFRGRVAIVVDIPQPTFYVVLNARDLHVTGAKAITDRAPLGLAAHTSARLANGGLVAEELVLAFDERLPAGRARLEMAYDAPFATDLAGLYRVEEDGRWYAYTQFEATDARRAFPCFDEPRFKTPFKIAVETPTGTVALSNAPAEPSRTASPPAEPSRTASPPAEPSRTATVNATYFETTPPLPSYLVALAVGPFDISQGRTDPFSIRVVTTHGHGQMTGLALETAAALIDKLGDYFDMSYPYAKLDLVAVPDFAAGAMENPGLVTFRDTLLLVDPAHATTSIKRSQAEVIAHEFAHQWFGDLVTMQWWDDLWLNEGFATWAEAKIVDAWRPSFGATLEQIAGVQGVMDTDALESARAVREPVRSTSEAKEAFDGITYDKGAAVLRMIEGWVGADTFQRGVQRYVHENAWKNAGAEDLFKAIDFVSTQHVGDLARAFLDQPGVPAVFVNWSCSGPHAGKLELRQSEWRPLGEGQRGVARKWTLPVCVASEGQSAQSCFTLGAEPIARTLGPRCPTWIYPNAGEVGYYRFILDRRQLLTLAGAGRALDPAARLGLLSNAWAGVRQGAIAPRVLLDVLPTFDGEANRFVVEQIVGVLAGVEHALVEDEAHLAFERYAAARLIGRKRALGWGVGKVDPNDDRALERRTVLWAMGQIANDGATLDEAETYAEMWLKDATSIPADTAAVAVPLASIRAGFRRLDELRAAAKRAKTPQDRIVAIRATGAFGDPAVLRQALDVTLTDEWKISELRYVFGEAMGRRETRASTYAWEKENWAKLRVRLPGSLAAGFADIAGTMCAPADRDDARAFFERETQGMEGVRRPLDQALERANLCIALRRYGADEVTKALRHR
jgi:aminopeptidase N